MTRKILDFLKSPVGKFLLFFLGIIIFAMVFRYYKSLPEPVKKKAESFNDTMAIEREYTRFRNDYEVLQKGSEALIKTKLEQKVEKHAEDNRHLEEKLSQLEAALAAEKALRAIVPKVEAKEKDTAKKQDFSLSPVSLYSAKVKKEKEKIKPLENYAPYGRLITCQLVNTVDSSSFETPVIAIVTEDLWHDGKVIIPAGTEVHGRAKSLTKRNRIETEKDWNVVWRTKTKENGFELPVTAIALDYAQDINTGQYSISDGSAGLRGDVIESDEYAKLKLYAALFLKGASEGVSELILEEAKSKDQSTIVNSPQAQSKSGSSEKGQVKVGLAKGASQAIDLYAKNMLDAITRDGVFVRVPAGQSFYLYVTQTIDKSKAFPGATSSQKNADPKGDFSDLEEAQKLLLALAKQKLKAQSQEKEETEK